MFSLCTLFLSNHKLREENLTSCYRPQNIENKLVNAIFCDTNNYLMLRVSSKTKWITKQTLSLKIGSRNLKVIILRLKIEIYSYLEKPRVGAGDPHKNSGDTCRALRTDDLRRSGDTPAEDNLEHCSKNPPWRTANCWRWKYSGHGQRPSRRTATEKTYDEDALVSYFPWLKVKWPVTSSSVTRSSLLKRWCSMSMWRGARPNGWLQISNYVDI